MKKKLSILLFISCLLVIYSCKKEYSCSSSWTKNKPPVANAGPDQTITLPITSTIIDGSSSYDSDHNIVSYRWTKILGPSSYMFENQYKISTLISSLTEGAYEFELTVTDADGLFTKDTVRIIVNDYSTSSNEIIFSGLEWNYWHDPNDIYHNFDEIYLWVSDTTNSIPDTVTSHFSVWVKRDSSGNWEIASNVISNGNCTVPFWYHLEYNRLLIELCYPWDLNLVGKKGEVKIIY